MKYKEFEEKFKKLMKDWNRDITNRTTELIQKIIDEFPEK